MQASRAPAQSGAKFSAPRQRVSLHIKINGARCPLAPQVRVGLASDDCATCARRSLPRFPTMLASLRPNRADVRLTELLCRSELVCRQPLAEIPPKESTLAPDQFPF